MLRALDIRDMLIIDRLELVFQPGLNVLTGETGAGKSILLDSLGFVLGWRGRAELVRKGAKQGEVVGVFDLEPDHPARTVLEDAGLPVSDELILRRINTVDGRKTAWVNDRRVSGDILRQLSETLVELHGQHDDRGLLNPRGHRKLVDEFAKLHDDLLATRKAWASYRAAQKLLSDAELALAEIREEEDFLRHAVDELDLLDPQSGEEAELDSSRRLMQAAEKVGEDITKAQMALGSGGAETSIVDATRWLEDAAVQVGRRLDAPISALTRALNELGEAQQSIQFAVTDMAFNATDLEETEERLFAIRALARKHDVQPDVLGDFATELRDRLAKLNGGEIEVAELTAKVATALGAYETKADRLTDKRKKAAGQLDKAMSVELAPLKMERAVFTTEVSPSDAGPDGKDTVAFTVATNPGAPSGAIDKIASGGELSRFLLALKVCLTKDAAGLTMIFDEIDRGVGGATADAVGRRLLQLAEKSQILVVTHSPQVAARGQHHWQVSKSVSKGVTTSTVTGLDEPARLDEVARMLAGDTITDEARGAARALLDG